MGVPFNEPFMPSSVRESSDALRTLGSYYENCKKLIKKQLGFERVILTPSCTSGLELIALTLNIKLGDEIILPSYTYVSTANAFALRGAKLIFVDTLSHHPTMDLDLVEKNITAKTKAIVVVHYGGVAINYEQLKRLKKKYSIPIVEDAAHCFGSVYKNVAVGSIGDFAAFSFHETKNISCGQGGAVVVNNQSYWHKANLIAMCGTNKIDFISKKVDFYSWKTIGSNYLLAEPLCVILLAGLKSLKTINKTRAMLFENYHKELSTALKEEVEVVSPLQKGSNGHIFYLTTKNKAKRDQLIAYLKKQGIEATFHYSPLHLSEFYLRNGGKKKTLVNTESFGQTLVRLPLFYQLSKTQQQFVIKHVKGFFKVQ